tara:strand:- start:47 stop:328 length:282 start_codon:yes stop_codon:yes gene_type:complete
MSDLFDSFNSLIKNDIIPISKKFIERNKDDINKFLEKISSDKKQDFKDLRDENNEIFNNNLNSQEYEDLEKRLISIRSKIILLQDKLSNEKKN